MPGRLPLEIGVSALNNLVYGVLLGAAGIAACTAVGLLVWWTEGNIGDGGAYAGAAALTLLGGAWFYLRRAWRERPSDAVFDADGIVIEGGASHGTRLAWAEIAAHRCELIGLSRDALFASEKVSAGFGLRIARNGGKPLMLAVADDDGDVQSLREIRDAIVARCSAALPPAPPAVPAPPAAPATPVAPATPSEPVAAKRKLSKRARRAEAKREAAREAAREALPASPPIERGGDGPRLIPCPKCAMPLAPSQEATVTCPGCAKFVTMPDDIRDRVRAALELPRNQRRVDRVAARLVDQPGARQTAAFLAGSFFLIGAAWPLAIAAGFHAHRVHELTVERGVALAVLPFLLIADGFFLSRLRLVDRRALAQLILHFAAIAPASPGAPPTCRSCGAPLPVDAGAAVLRCVFCSVANLTTLDLRAGAARAEQTADALDRALHARARDRLRWQLLTLASVPMFAITYVVLRHVL
jgi:hypothetical protein